MNSSGGLSLRVRRGQVAEGLMDRIDDAVIGAAAAEIAAHPLAQFVVTERDRLRLEIRSDVARHALAKFGRHADRRADLTGRAIAALEPVMFDEGLLQGMERAGRAEALDRRDLAAFDTARPERGRN